MGAGASFVDATNQEMQQVQSIASEVKKFEDADFPADSSSVWVSGQPPKNEEGVFLKKEPVWIRPAEICSANSPTDGDHLVPTLFDGDPTPGRVLEGQLGDCFFIAAVSLLCQRPEIVRSLFAWQELQSCGAMVCKFFHGGQWKAVIVDDRSPCNPDNQRPMFGHTTRLPEMWLTLLEKAYAKLYGGFENISGGNISEALRDLTGCAVQDYNLESNEVKEEIASGKLWNALSSGMGQVGDRADASSKLIGCAKIVPPSEICKAEGKGKGLLANHAYGVTKMAVVQAKKGGSGPIRLVRVRNPWGYFEWQGEWSKGSSKWTPALRAQLGYSAEATDDGEFWMSWKDFKAQFNRIYCCLLDAGQRSEAAATGATTAHIVREGCWDSKGSGGSSHFPGWRRDNPLFELVLPDGMDGAGGSSVVLSLSQPDSRMSARSAGEAVSYNQIGLSVVSIAEKDWPQLSADKWAIVARTSFWNKRDVAIEIPMTQLLKCKAPTQKGAKAAKAGRNRLIVVPSTYFPGKYGDFFLTATVSGASGGSGGSAGFALEPLDSATLGAGRGWCGASCNGKWTKVAKDAKSARATAAATAAGNGAATAVVGEGGAVGRPSNSSPDFWKNPKYVLTCMDRARGGAEGASGDCDNGEGKEAEYGGDDTVDVVIFLSQAARPTAAAAAAAAAVSAVGADGTSGNNKYAELQKYYGLGINVMRGWEGLAQCKAAGGCGSLSTDADDGDFVGVSLFTNTAEVARRIELKRSDFPVVIIPCTYDAGQSCAFTLDVMASSSVELQFASDNDVPAPSRSSRKKSGMQVRAGGPVGGKDRGRGRGRGSGKKRTKAKPSMGAAHSGMGCMMMDYAALEG
jgi:hypothetical protein